MKKRTTSRRNSDTYRSQLLRVGVQRIADPQRVKVKKSHSCRKNVRRVMGREVSQQISKQEVKNISAPEYHINYKKVLEAYGKMRKGRVFHASRRVLWRNRHRLVLGRRDLHQQNFYENSNCYYKREKEYFVPEPPEDGEDPQWLDMGLEYSSDEAGDGPVSSDDYNPDNDKARKRKLNQRKAKLKWMRKRKQKDSGARSSEYKERTKRRRIDPSKRKEEIKRKTERMQAGLINRAREDDI